MTILPSQGGLSSVVNLFRKFPTPREFCGGRHEQGYQRELSSFTHSEPDLAELAFRRSGKRRAGGKFVHKAGGDFRNRRQDSPRSQRLSPFASGAGSAATEVRMAH